MAEQVIKKREMAGTMTSKLPLFKAAAETQEQKKKLEDQEAKMKEYKEREQSLNQGIQKYLVSQYGHNGDPPPKEKKSSLIV